MRGVGGDGEGVRRRRLLPAAGDAAAGAALEQVEVLDGNAVGPTMAVGDAARRSPGGTNQSMASSMPPDDSAVVTNTIRVLVAGLK